MKGWREPTPLAVVTIVLMAYVGKYTAVEF
jgi:hypothetical protein